MRKLLFIFFLVGCGSGSSDPTPMPTPSPTISSSDDCLIIPTTIFNKNSGSDWKVVDWYDSSRLVRDKVEFTDDGIKFNNPSANTHTDAILNNLDSKDVSKCSELVLTFKGVVTGQTLPGTGYDDREAPLSVTVRYVDENGKMHNTLNAYNEGEPDDRKTTRMFWKGFSADNSRNVNENTIKVTKDVLFTESFDLMKLTPKPKKIEMVAISSAGWPSVRSGIAKSISLGKSTQTTEPNTTSTSCPCPKATHKNCSGQLDISSTYTIYWKYEFVKMCSGDYWTRLGGVDQSMIDYLNYHLGEWNFNQKISNVLSPVEFSVEPNFDLEILTFKSNNLSFV
jgi:hypothetical protein